ncbi:hypothetical protein [Armatimonas sp.]|uniref:hypothetical protein n=1 Tax=Armatimonas sp. TaxID=1872638 RepID=UPI00374D071B
MTLRYEMTLDDQVKYNLYLQNKQYPRRSKRATVGFYVMMIVMTALMLLTSLWEASFRGPQVYHLFVLVFVAFFLYIAWASTEKGQRTLVEKQVRKNTEFLKYVGQREVRLEPLGIRSIAVSGERFLTWESVTLEESEEALVFSLSLLDSIVVPKRVFSTPQHQAEFVAAVERFRQGQAEGSEPLKQSWYQSKDQVG